MTYRERVIQVSEAHSYAEGFNGRLTKYRTRTISEYIKGGTVLELGCGEGAITRFLVKTCVRVVALEPAPRFYNILTEKVRSPNLETHKVFTEDFQSDEKFDYVVASGVLEHVEDVSKFLESAKRFMRKDSQLLLTVPNATSLHRRIGKEMGLIGSLDELGPLDKKVGHYRYYDFPTLRQDLEANGLSVQTLEGIFLKPFPSMDMMWLPEEYYYDALYEVGKQTPEFCAEIFAVSTLKEQANHGG